VSTGDITITIVITPATGNPNPNNECANARSRDLITVSVALPFNKVALVAGEYLDGKNLIGRSAMRHE
jgi:hypothetical protein